MKIQFTYMLFVLNVVGLEMIQKPLMIERNVHKNLIQIVRNFYVTIWKKNYWNNYEYKFTVRSLLNFSPADNKMKGGMGELFQKYIWEGFRKKETQCVAKQFLHSTS